VFREETLFIVGESRSGKSTLGFALLNLVPQPGCVKEGEVVYRIDGKDVNLMKLPPEEQRKFRWKHVPMVFQAALNAKPRVAGMGSALRYYQGPQQEHVQRKGVR